MLLLVKLGPSLSSRISGPKPSRSTILPPRHSTPCITLVLSPPNFLSSVLINKRLRKHACGAPIFFFLSFTPRYCTALGNKINIDKYGTRGYSIQLVQTCVTNSSSATRLSPEVTSANRTTSARAPIIGSGH